MGIFKAAARAVANSAVNGYENKQLKNNSKKAYDATGKKLNGKGKSRKIYKKTYAQTKEDLDRQTKNRTNTIRTFINDI